MNSEKTIDIKLHGIVHSLTLSELETLAPLLV